MGFTLQDLKGEQVYPSDVSGRSDTLGLMT